LTSAVSGQLRAAHASLYVAAVPELAPSFARLASASGGWAVTASSARSLMPAVDAIGADLVHQYLLAYATAYPALTPTRLRVAVSEAGTTATAEATVRVPASHDWSTQRTQASAGALRILVTSKASTANQIVGVILFVLIEFSLIIIPFAFLELRPEATKGALRNAQDWLLRHARQLMAYTALILGAYLAVSGLVQLLT
jgi:hypothetical protein